MYDNQSGLPWALEFFIRIIWLEKSVSFWGANFISAERNLKKHKEMSSYDYCEFKIEADTSFNNVVEIQDYYRHNTLF